MQRLFYIPGMLWETMKEIKGIGLIVFEWRILMWAFVCFQDFFKQIVPSIIILVAIVIMVSSVFNIRRPHIHMHFHRIFHHIWGFIMRVLLAWVLIVVGVFAGRRTNAGQVTRTISYPVIFGRETYSFVRYSLHFFMGVGLFRLFFNILGLFRINNDARTIIARICALVVIFWGIWVIPADIIEIITY